MLNEISKCFFGLGIIGFILTIYFKDACAWGSAGHRIVANIAELNLEPKVISKIRREFNIKHLSNVAVWADDKKIKRARPIVLHYTNIAESQRIYNQPRDCPEKNCVTEKIKDFISVLENKTFPWIKRFKALKFLVHLVADVHQPMHLGNAEDRGGNEIKLNMGEESINLHALWDHFLLPTHNNKLRDLARKLNNEIGQNQKEDWSQSTVVDWTNESRELVLDFAYQVKFNSQRTLSDEYIKQGRKIVKHQLSKAGIRLSHTLNQIIK